MKGEKETFIPPTGMTASSSPKSCEKEKMRITLLVNEIARTCSLTDVDPCYEKNERDPQLTAKCLHDVDPWLADQPSGILSDDHYDLKDFLCEMLKGEFGLNESVIPEVLDRCGCDVKRGMEELLNMLSSMLKIDDILSSTSHDDLSLRKFNAYLFRVVKYKWSIIKDYIILGSDAFVKGNRSMATLHMKAVKFHLEDIKVANKLSFTQFPESRKKNDDGVMSVDLRMCSSKDAITTLQPILSAFRTKRLKIIVPDTNSHPHKHMVIDLLQKGSFKWAAEGEDTILVDMD